MSYKVACQTPEDECGAPLIEVNNNLLGQGRPRKLHSDHEEAFNCYAGYLVKTGHKRVGGREFLQPQGGILVLTKKSRYGGRFRTGKTQDGKGGKRFMPAAKKGDTPNGLLIG